MNREDISCRIVLSYCSTINREIFDVDDVGEDYDNDIPEAVSMWMFFFSRLPSRRQAFHLTWIPIGILSLPSLSLWTGKGTSKLSSARQTSLGVLNSCPSVLFGSLFSSVRMSRNLCLEMATDFRLHDFPPPRSDLYLDGAL